MVIVLFFFLTYNLLFSQHVVWPTDASQLMTSSFGEYREGHIHAGIDIKTWGKEGYRVFAIDRGSIFKVRVSPYGYGKAIYLLLDSGITVVYGHLSHFSEELERLIKIEQLKRGRFSLEKSFHLQELRVEQGDLIGYTGSTGIGAPHLHFEVRDLENRPYNPLFLGYKIKDNRMLKEILNLKFFPFEKLI